MTENSGTYYNAIHIIEKSTWAAKMVEFDPQRERKIKKSRSCDRKKICSSTKRKRTPQIGMRLRENTEAEREY